MIRRLVWCWLIFPLLAWAACEPLHGPGAPSAALGDTVLPTTPNGRLYRCTTAGVCGAGEPTWPTADGGTVADGAAVWTEMTPDFEANANLTEVVGGGYARVAIAANATSWSGTQAPGSTAVSSGSDGTIENNVAIAFGAPSANWGVIAGWTSNDAATAGNAWDWSVLATPKTVNNGDAAPSFPASAMSIQIDA